MATATPVLERETEELRYDYLRAEDERHNASIKERYAKLINPENKLSDLHAENMPVQDIAPVQEVPVQPIAPVMEQQPVSYEPKPYWVENARADSDLFRADSIINCRAPVQEVQAEMPVVAASYAPQEEEEENEDSMPTSTTRQYKSIGVNKTIEEGTITNVSSGNRINLSKRDKIIIAVVVTVIVALFVLIIVNSAIISGINSDLSSLQSSLNTAKNAYQNVNRQITDYTANFEDTIRALAESLGMEK